MHQSYESLVEKNTILQDDINFLKDLVLTMRPQLSRVCSLFKQDATNTHPPLPFTEVPLKLKCNKKKYSKYHGALFQSKIGYVSDFIAVVTQIGDLE